MTIGAHHKPINMVITHNNSPHLKVIQVMTAMDVQIPKKEVVIVPVEREVAIVMVVMAVVPCHGRTI
jgi:hypothetical protein